MISCIAYQLSCVVGHKHKIHEHRCKSTDAGKDQKTHSHMKVTFRCTLYGKIGGSFIDICIDACYIRRGMAYIAV